MADSDPYTSLSLLELYFNATQRLLEDTVMRGFTEDMAALYYTAAVLGALPNELITAQPVPQLDNSQLRSFWILWHWWSKFRVAWDVPAHAPPGEWRRLRAEDKFYDPRPLGAEIDYFSAIWLLFESEFHGLNHPFKQKKLQEDRKVAALHSACYFTAIACEKSFQVSSQPFFPKAAATPSPGNLRKILNTNDLPGLHPSCYTGATISSCSWIKDASEFPFYLWDVKNEQTIEAATLTSQPCYTAISHTWGRWRTGISIKLPFVPDWEVPQNSIFDVNQIPSLMNEVPVLTPYIWFDLVCIPQNNSERADIEIAKQASIFRQATHTIIWFNQIQDWTGLRQTVEWMAQKYLPRFDNLQFNIPDLPTRFFYDYDFGENTKDSDMEASGWFTSLWTLQEICLRPDMWLCSFDWQLFTVGENIPIPFNTIVALAGECFNVLNTEIDLEENMILDLSRTFTTRTERLRAMIRDRSYPRGFIELLELFDRTGMRDLQMIKKDYILLLGSQRYCESRRAEAIMSVLDAKRWISLKEPGPLVLGQYELEFVREVAQEVGSSFYNSLSCSLDAHLVMNPSSRGSLLPFEDRSSGFIESKMILNWEFGSEVPNPSVYTWVIQQNGAVEIPEAAILTSTLDSSKVEMLSTVWLTYREPEDENPRFNLHHATGSRHRSCDLRNWCRSYHNETANYAVELGRVMGASRGLLLKETKSDSKRLYKVGNYFTSMHQYYGQEVMSSQSTPAEQVDWTVL